VAFIFGLEAPVRETYAGDPDVLFSVEEIGRVAEVGVKSVDCLCMPHINEGFDDRGRTSLNEAELIS